jgi:RHS repeat-associated protein
VVFTKGATGVAETVQEDHYYPFGLQLSGQSFTNTTLLNKYLFNGKEKQDQTGMYDYGFRQMDPVLGRWFCVDRMAEKYLSTSPYVYVFDNPMRFIDPDGLDPMYTSQPWVVDWYADGQDEDWDVNNGVETLLHDGPGHAITSSCNTSLPKPDDNEKPNEYEDPSWWQSLSEDMTTQGERSARQEAHDGATPGGNFEVGPVISPSDFVGHRDNVDCGQLADEQSSVLCVLPGGDDAKYHSHERIYMYYAYGNTLGQPEESTPNRKSIQNGTLYAMNEIDNCRPVKAVVDYSSNVFVNACGGDHCITIVGYGKDRGGFYFRFFDNATVYEEYGTDPKNRLYWDSGTNSYYSADAPIFQVFFAPQYYRLTQIRINISYP